MSAREKSDLPEVAEKRANKAVSAAAELLERRGGAKENAGLQSTVRTRERKAESEVVEIAVPAIIEPDTFEQVQRQLHARSPRRQPPRVTTGPILLTGLAVCATCRGG